MNLKTYAEKSGLTLAEAKEQTGLTHWNQSVPEILEADVEILEEPESVMMEEPTVTVIETESKEEVVDPQVIELSIRCLGTKSQYWDKRHLIGR